MNPPCAALASTSCTQPASKRVRLVSPPSPAATPPSAAGESLLERLPLDVLVRCAQLGNMSVRENLALQRVSRTLCAKLRSDVMWRCVLRGDWDATLNRGRMRPAESTSQTAFADYTSAASAAVASLGEVSGPRLCATLAKTELLTPLLSQDVWRSEARMRFARGPALHTGELRGCAQGDRSLTQPFGRAEFYPRNLLWQLHVADAHQAVRAQRAQVLELLTRGQIIALLRDGLIIGREVPERLWDSWEMHLLRGASLLVEAAAEEFADASPLSMLGLSAAALRRGRPIFGGAFYHLSQLGFGAALPHFAAETGVVWRACFELEPCSARISLPLLERTTPKRDELPRILRSGIDVQLGGLLERDPYVYAYLPRARQLVTAQMFAAVCAYPHNIWAVPLSSNMGKRSIAALTAYLGAHQRLYALMEFIKRWYAEDFGKPDTLFLDARRACDCEAFLFRTFVDAAGVALARGDHLRDTQLIEELSLAFVRADEQIYPHEVELEGKIGRWPHPLRRRLLRAYEQHKLLTSGSLFLRRVLSMFSPDEFEGLLQGSEAL